MMIAIGTYHQRAQELLTRVDCEAAGAREWGLEAGLKGERWQQELGARGHAAELSTSRAGVPLSRRRASGQMVAAGPRTLAPRKRRIGALVLAVVHVRPDGEESRGW